MFQLDARLEKDTVLIGHLSLCRVLLMNDARYPWLILVPQRAGVTEVFQLSAEEQGQLIREVSRTAELMMEHFNADKMNVAALGNVVSQLHLHVVARYQEDEVWPDPVWGRGKATPYDPAALLERRLALVEILSGSGASFLPAA